MTLTVGSLFAGIGGLDRGLERAGFAVAWQVEIDPFCREVLAKHWPDVPRFEDVRCVGATELERVDLICGGFPCTDVSVAGKRKGLQSARSGLWFDYARIIDELKPRMVLVENVYRGWRQWLPTVRRNLHEIGYSSLSIRLRASDFGAPHERARCFVLARLDADTHGQRQLQPGWGLEEVRQRPCDCTWWAAEPAIPRVLYGVPGRLERTKVLGNAVVPQLAEWLGCWCREILKNGACWT